ncbi:DENN domain-containing protein 3 isoform X2 [Clupea harengus]|uniref:DENN domain-containing protein 3 isoform X2 n=1 Tax=Clupea harengus TaxID=7950 RepID=A0A8M1KMM1_CLUHA|nr:DENN domain-containing protein 3 isoform X2 [Clupea harengus]
MEDHLPPGLLVACVVVGATTDKLKEAYQHQQERRSDFPVLEAEVLQVHVPPFVSKEKATDSVGPSVFGRVQRRRSFIKKKERPALPPGDSSPGGDEATQDISVPNDIDLVGLPQLCFPGGLTVWSEPKEPSFHFLVFTDVFGNQTHGVVLQYCRPVQLFQESFRQQNGLWSKASWHYTAYGVCIISKYPYYNALRDCLSCLLSQLKHCRITDLDQRMKEFSAKLALVPIPPPGDLHLVFNLSPLVIVLPSREDKHHPVVDLDLHLPFLCFQTRELLQIITAILAERRIVFFSSDWARLTVMAECFMLYIHPLHWQHPLVPTLPHQMLDFVMAPTAFLMGCHLSHFEEVSAETDDLILINIDDGTVSSSSSELSDLPAVPSAAAECFRTRRRGLQLHYDLEISQQGGSTAVNELRAQRRLWQQRLNWEIQNISLELIVNIFRGVADHLNYEHRVFNSQEFLKSREPLDQPFYKEVLESHIFHIFLKDRLNRKMDAYTRMEQSTRSEAEKRLKVMIDNLRRPTMKEMRRSSSSENCAPKRMGTSLPNLREERHLGILRHTSVTETPLKIRQKHVKQFQLPDFHPHLSYKYVQDYYADLVGLLGKAISFTPRENSSLLARYYYLRGVVNTMCTRRLDALSDFQNLNHTDVEIFPAELVRALVDSLQHEEQAQVDRRPELKRLVCRVKSSETGEVTVQPTDDHVKKFKMPKTHMPLENFVTHIQESGIVRDVGTIHRLFDALSVGPQKEVDPDVFRVFYTFWKEMEAEAQDVHLPAEVMEQLDNNECVYKISCSVKTNYGVGKIAMTQKRLFLLPDGRRGFVDITKFRDIVEVKISSAQFLLLRIPSLRIKSNLKKEVFEANLRSECDLWSLMIKEMWAGRKMADDHKDPQHMQQALTNVLLMDTVVGCLQSQKGILAASKLAYYDRLKHEVPTAVPKTTSDTLKHRINPSLHLPSQQTVDVLLYTPGQLEKSDIDGDGNPKLWCALSHGRVVVFDAASWSMQQNGIQVGALPLSCMLGLDQEQVWMGSRDSTIYIINARSMSCHKQLTEHRGEVTDLVLEDRQDASHSPTLAYSCSLDGMVIVWDVSTLKMRRQFNLSCHNLTSMQLYNRTLWCCANDCIMELRKTGVVQRKICLLQDPTTPPSPFNGFIVYLERDQIWTSRVDSSELCVWHSENLEKPAQRVQLPDSAGVTSMLKVKNQIWVGCRSLSENQSGVVGKIFVVDVAQAVVEKELLAHTDSVQALCSAEDRYVLSGSACLDGKIAIWKVE